MVKELRWSGRLQTIFNATDSTLVVLNVGGIANISVLTTDKRVHRLPMRDREMC
ncbi:anhydro-N-acetylmuramic acid kinase [Vibrio metschnikovii]